MSILPCGCMALCCAVKVAWASGSDRQGGIGDSEANCLQACMAIMTHMVTDWIYIYIYDQEVT